MFVPEGNSQEGDDTVMFVPKVKGEEVNWHYVDLYLEDSADHSVNVVAKSGPLHVSLATFVRGEKGIRLRRATQSDEHMKRVGVDSINGKIVFNE